MKNETTLSRSSTLLIVIISLLVAGLHLLVGPDYKGPAPSFVNGYLLDICLPMNAYLLTQLALRKALPPQTSRLVGVLFTGAFGVLVEFLQRQGIHFLGSTFDPVDLLMYALGILMGLGIDWAWIRNEATHEPLSNKYHIEH